MSALQNQPSTKAKARAQSRTELVRERQLRETEAQFQTIAQQWLVKERQNQELAYGFKIKDEQLQTKDHQLGTKDQQLLLKDQQLQINDVQLRAGEQQLQIKEAQLQTKDQQLQTKDTQLQAKDEQLQAKDQQLQTKDEQLQTKDKELQTKDTQLQSKDRQLEIRDQQLQNKDQQLVEKDAWLKEKEQQLQTLDGQLQITAQQLSVREEHVRDLLESRAFRIGTTLTWPVRTLRHSDFWHGNPRRAPHTSREQTHSATHSMPEAHEQPATLEAGGQSAMPEASEQRPVNEQQAPLQVEKIPRRPLTPTRNKGTLVVGVVTFNNTAQQLAQLLRSVEIAASALADREVPLRLFVIDNGEASVCPQTKIPFERFASQGNIGFGRAMNLLMASAFETAATEWFLCLNPDGIMHRKALTELLHSSRSCPDALIEARQFPEEHVKEYDPQTLETPWASGACLLIRRRIYEAIGGFDQNFFMYLEDIDFSWRARSAGFNVKISPNALLGHAVIHRTHEARTDTSFLLSGRYLAHKWHDSKFFDWTEQELVKRGYYRSRKELPALPEANTNADEIDTRLANFKHYFHFSPARVDG